MGFAVTQSKKHKINQVLDTFLQHNDVEIEDNIEKIKKTNLITTRDNLKYQLAMVLLDNWFLYEVAPNEYVFVKHILSDKQNLMYQIILGEEDYSGVYEFQFVGKDVKVENNIKNNKCYLEISSKGNFGLAVFEKEEVISLMEQSEKDFVSSLHRFLTKEEIDMYYKSNLNVKNYLIRNLPRIILSAE